MNAQTKLFFGVDPAVGPEQSFGAMLSPCRRYRWRLWRVWDPSKPKVVWVMLNPSVADAHADDATIRRCVGFAKQWGYGGIVVVNLFALISTDPKGLLGESNAIGRPENIEHIYAVIDDAPGLIVAAWGNNVPKGYEHHEESIISILRGRGAQCLGLTNSGRPKHPLRLNYNMKLRAL
jgi:hypothetical protein